MSRVVAAACLLAAVAAAAPVPKPAKPSLDGTWEMVRQTAYGEERPLNATFRWIIDGESLVWERDGVKEEAGANSLIRPKGGADNARDNVLNTLGGKPCHIVYPGVYALDGDTLLFCYAPGEKAERPAECKAGPGLILFEFKRVRSK